MSCRSCHADGQAGGLVVDTLADGGFGAPKRVTSLLGVGATGPWTWLGTVDRLEDQVRKSIETSMRGPSPSSAQVDDLTAYLRSLPPPKPMPAEGPVERGRAIFRERKCAECHAPPEYTSEGAFDVGLVDEVGHRKFNPPSLRGVGDRASYLHDGRAATLPEVFLRHRHPRDSAWSTEEVEALAAFLRTL
jgi:cytochrome c peroxidase